MHPPPDRIPADFPTDLSTSCWLEVVLATPGLRPLHYFLPHAPENTTLPIVGSWVLAPLGRRTLLGLVTAIHTQDPGEVAVDRLRPVQNLLSTLPLVSPATLAFYRFIASYYRRPLGAVLASAVPPYLRVARHHLPTTRASLVTRLARKPLTPAQAIATPHTTDDGESAADPTPLPWPALTAAQTEAVEAIRHAAAEPKPSPLVLHGVTGSGKTRVYMEAMRLLWETDPHAQVLLLVPEIGLTPALEMRMRLAFPQIAQTSLHSSMGDAARAQSWLWATTGQARLVMGTRLAILTPLPALALIIVDEEHDASYKQQDGLRYSARDLAVYRAQQQDALVILGSATPSLETLHAIGQGRYQRLPLPEQATGARRAAVSLIDTLKDPAVNGLSQTSRRAIASALAAGSHVLVFLNRRGWAPVLGCEACPWTGACLHCNTAMVLHKKKRQWRLICHHCGGVTPVPSACPDCGASDLTPMGQGTQKIEAALKEAFAQTHVVRIDRDTVRSAQDMEAILTSISTGPPQILVGTQMMAKGHDLSGLNLVVVVDADPQLVHPDFRAPEWLLSVLVQVAGRAGRHRAAGRDDKTEAQVLVQTRYPQHPLFQALLTQQSEQYAQTLLEERRAARLPPFSHMAMVRLSDTREDRLADWAARLHQHLTEWLRAQMATAPAQAAHRTWQHAHAYPPAPDYPERQGNRLRWHLVLEAPTRQQRALLAQAAESFALDNPGVEALIEIDPLSQS
ncbi:MAG: replication restart helicase PriA [Burkholderiaceae bacterium]